MPILRFALHWGHDERFRPNKPHLLPDIDFQYYFIFIILIL